MYPVCYSHKCLIQHAVMRPCLWRYANCISEVLFLKGLAVAFVGSSAWQLVEHTGYQGIVERCAVLSQQRAKTRNVCVQGSERVTGNVLIHSTVCQMSGGLSVQLQHISNMTQSSYIHYQTE